MVITLAYLKYGRILTIYKLKNNFNLRETTSEIYKLLKNINNQKVKVLS